MSTLELSQISTLKTIEYFLDGKNGFSYFLSRLCAMRLKRIHSD